MPDGSAFLMSLPSPPNRTFRFGQFELSERERELRKNGIRIKLHEQPPSANVTLDADGARYATINTVTDSVHSGFIVAAPQERIGLSQTSNGVTRFRLIFTHSGTCNYICAPHDELGMTGGVVVLP